MVLQRPGLRPIVIKWNYAWSIFPIFRTRRDAIRGGADAGCVDGRGACGAAGDKNAGTQRARREHTCGECAVIDPEPPRSEARGAGQAGGDAEDCPETHDAAEIAFVGFAGEPRRKAGEDGAVETSLCRVDGVAADGAATCAAAHGAGL